jgi:hypothetical protein
MLSLAAHPNLQVYVAERAYYYELLCAFRLCALDTGSLPTSLPFLLLGGVILASFILDLRC